MSRALGSAESQERLRALGIEPRPERDLLHYLASEFQEGVPMRVTNWRASATGQQLSDREISRLEVLHAIRILPWRQRRVIELRYVDGLTVDMTAERLRTSRDTVQRETAAALRTMAQIIYEWL